MYENLVLALRGDPKEVASVLVMAAESHFRTGTFRWQPMDLSSL